MVEANDNHFLRHFRLVKDVYIFIGNCLFFYFLDKYNVHLSLRNVTFYATMSALCITGHYISYLEFAHALLDIPPFSTEHLLFFEIKI